MEVIFYEIATTESTNDLSKKLLPQLNKEALTVVYTWDQTGGRGQYGKSWSSTRKDITASFCFFIPSQNLDIALLVRPGAEAVVALANSLGIKKPHIKWPNDVLVEHKKIAGILCETVPLGSSTGVILGIGLNVNSSEDDLQNVGQPATSLLLETDSCYEPESILSHLSLLIRTHIKPVIKEIIGF